MSISSKSWTIHPHCPSIRSICCRASCSGVSLGTGAETNAIAAPRPNLIRANEKTARPVSRAALKEVGTRDVLWGLGRHGVGGSRRAPGELIGACLAVMLPDVAVRRIVHAP